MTNFIFTPGIATNIISSIMLLSKLSTNWVNFSGDFHRENGTNKIHQYQMIVTNIQWVEVKLCTNVLASISQSDGTNGVTRWVQVDQPSLPGQFNKP